jgi:hypothetical protein
MSCGAALHHLRVALAASGLASTVDRLPDPAEPDHLAAIELLPRPAAPADLALATAILRRRSDRRRFKADNVPDLLVTELIADAAAHGASLQPVMEVGARAHLVDAIRTASEDRVDQPADGEPDSSILMVLATASDAHLARLRAGEALSAVLLRATALGLATCPLSRPLEVGPSRQAARARPLARGRGVRRRRGAAARAPRGVGPGRTPGPADPAPAGRRHGRVAARRPVLTSV